MDANLYDRFRVRPDGALGIEDQLYIEKAAHLIFTKSTLTGYDM